LYFSLKLGKLNIGAFMIAAKQDTAAQDASAVENCVYGDCPLHAENPPLNAKVLAAIEESRAVMRGDISAKWYNSLEEARKDLNV
jgi:predicted lipoprotein